MSSIIKLKSNNSTKQSKAYIKYEKLLADIEKQKQFKLNLEEGLQKAFVKINAELLPLQQEGNLLLRDYILRLDALVIEIGIGKFNREWIENYMADEITVLLGVFGYQDKVLLNLYEKYAGLTINDLVQDENAVAMARSCSELFGFEVDVKEILEKGETGYFEAHKDKILEHFNNMRENFAENEPDDKKSNKKEGTNKKFAADTAQLAKDARSIYMRLIKKFHPDLEKDTGIREQKTEIIKQVTKAFQENDFYTLLKLQITYLDEQEADATALADDMLKQYNKLLTKQLNELNSSIHETHFTNGNAVADFIDKNGKFSPQKFAARRREIEKENAAFKQTLIDSKKRPKGWFKDQIGRIKESVQQNMMYDMFNNMFGDL